MPDQDVATASNAEPGRATLATVAASAGVSVATVSKVLNGRTDVAPATRAKVAELLQQHDYVGRRAESDRVPGSSRPAVELIFLGDLNAYGIEILHGLIDTGAALGVPIVVGRRPRDRTGVDRPAGWARELVAAGRRAVITVVDDLTAKDVAALARAQLPLVVIDPLNLPRARVTSVGSTNFAGGLTATQHLLALGHRRIAYVGGPVTAACNQARMHGFRAAMEAAGVAVREEYVRTGHFLYDDGASEGARLLDLPEPPTAIFASSDETALGVIEAARSRGLRIPEHLSIVGFDDTQAARHASPPLTTVRQPLREMGAQALRTALRLADGQTLESHHVELATELIVRRSTAPVPL